MFSFPIERLFFEPYITESNKDNKLDIYNPSTDLVETDKNFKLSLDLPGIEKTDINIDLDPKNILTVSAERKTEDKKEGDKWHINERTYKKFSRSIRLPRDIDSNSIKAIFENGVLVITIDKMVKPEIESKKILIQ